jgi:hypothetical protein
MAKDEMIIFESLDKEKVKEQILELSWKRKKI